MNLSDYPYLKKFGKNVVIFIITMFVLSIIVFVMARLAPGDPLQAFYGDALDTMSIEEMDAARIRLGLDGPIYYQYVKWLLLALGGDFGLSLQYKMPAMDVIAPLIGNTIILGLTAYILVFALAIVLAVICAKHEDTLLDKVICKIGTMSYFIPAFWLGLVLILIFSVNLNWFQSSGAYDYGQAGNIANRIWHMILPLTVMIFSHIWYYAYMIRNKLLDENRKDYVLLAKIKGLTKSEILWKHSLRNIAPTIVNLMAISIPHVLGGTVIAEAVFNYPGIGNMAISAAKYHDYNLLMLLVLITGSLVIITSMCAYMINEVIDPRMKDAGGTIWEK
ncbi:ABC transporter permease [uncultured Methanocorpusculum sp.]|nr:ABC transporter permease [uncultured Methanocorpusculum sp.]